MERAVIIALGASLALNFLGAGYVIGQAVSGDKAPPPPQEVAVFNGPRDLAGGVRQLPPESRRAFRREMTGALPNMRRHHQALNDKRAELRVLLEADEWDAEAVDAVMKEIRQLRANQSEAFDTALLAGLNAISAEDRRMLIELTERRRKQMRERFRERREERRPPPQNQNAPRSAHPGLDPGSRSAGRSFAS